MLRFNLLLCGVALAAAGCGGSDEPRIYDDSTKETAKRIEKVCAAYMQFAQNSRKSPTAEDLKSALGKNGDAAVLLTSPRDGKPFVIVDGFRPGMAQASDERSYVAYEQVGANGERVMVDGRGVVSVVPDAEFATIKFAGGHKPKL